MAQRKLLSTTRMNQCAPNLDNHGGWATSRLKNSRQLLALLACLMVVVRAAAADMSSNSVALIDMPLESLMQIEVPQVYGASKLDQKVTQAPASVTIITSDEIKKYGYQTLGDLLESAQGFYVSNDRNYQYLGTRGVSLGDFNSRVLIMVDGHRVNNNLTDGAFIGNAFILDLALADRVEIIRGPNAVLYGNNAFL